MKSLRIEIKYALISAVVLVIWVMGEHVLGYNSTRMEMGKYTQPIIPLIILVILVLGMRAKKISLAGLTFGQGVKTAFLISLFYAILQGLWFTVYADLINPSYAELSRAFQEKELMAQGKSPEEIADRLAFARTLFDGGWHQFLFFLVTTPVINTIVGIIALMFLKSKRSS